MKISMEEIQEAQNLIDNELFNSLEHGEEIKLTKNLCLYRYTEEDIYVLNDLNEWDELYQVMKSDDGFILEKI